MTASSRRLRSVAPDEPAAVVVELPPPPAPPERPAELGWFDDDDQWHPPEKWRDGMEAAVLLAAELASTVPVDVLLVAAEEIAFRARRLSSVLDYLLDSLPKDVG